MIRLAAPRTESPERPGGVLVSTSGEVLPLRATELQVSATSGVARVTLRQCFVNSHNSALVVNYSLPLPADGAVRGFSFVLGDERIHGQIERCGQARQQYENALLAGYAAALVAQRSTSVFEQEIGNIPPGGEVECEVVIDQPLAWIAPGHWEWRFPTAVGPRYLRQRDVSSAKKRATIASREAIALRMGLELTVNDTVSGAVSSPSHAIKAETRAGATKITLGEGARLDRDLVIRWSAAKIDPGLTLAGTCSGAAGDRECFGLLTLVPPKHSAGMDVVPRDLIVLMDISGSMDGAPIGQAKRIVRALIDSLGARDRLEIIAFSQFPRRWQPEAAFATVEQRAAASEWVESLQAGGGTEMMSAILEAMRSLRVGSQRQIVLVTDGYIGFERQLVESVLSQLPSSCRVHTVGVGSAVNRTLTHGVARAGGGQEVIVGIGEDVEPVIQRISRRLRAPLITELEIDGDGVLEVVPATLPDLFADSPAMISLKLNGHGGRLRVRGTTADGAYDEEIVVPAFSPDAANGAIAALYAREKVEDLETRLTAGSSRAEVDLQIEELGLRFGIATRLTSWVGIGRRVIASGSPVFEEMPHEVPFGVAADSAGYSAASVSKPLGLPEIASLSETTAAELGETTVTAVRNTEIRPDTKEACLVTIYGDELGKRFQLDRASTLIGRSSTADIQLDHDSVSRNHCELVNTGANLIVRDFGSTNGTYVNDELVDERVLRGGDYIKVGHCILKFLTGSHVEHAYHEEIYRLTTIDGLTTAYNKRYFGELLERETGRAQRYRRELSLIFFDLDKFKSINDTMGHLAGDAVLKKIAALVQGSIRRDDTLARYGGEEFAIVLPEMGRAQALIVAEKIRLLVEKANIEFEGARIPVTISVGVATLEGHWSATDFIREADARLYEAKENGRNRVQA